MAKYKIAFGWYGGKYSHLKWLLPLLPECHHYCEPFAGSAAVLMNRTPSRLETYNDLDGEVVNFFRVLRDSPTELLALLDLTPYARREFAVAISNERGLSDIERARRFFVRVRQVRFGQAQAATVGRWSAAKHNHGSEAHVVTSRNSILKLHEVSNRLLTVQFENRPALDVIRYYDDPETLFYCDPPYVLSTRTDTHIYQNELVDDDHVALAVVLKACKAKVAISGYRSVLYDELYSGWRRFDAPKRTLPSSRMRTQQECLWMNYDDVSGQPNVIDTEFDHMFDACEPMVAQ